MKKIMVGLLVLAASVSNAAFVPASVTKQNQAPKLIDVRERTALEIAARSAAGYHFASVDMDGANWKTENAIMRELQALGYTVETGSDHHTYGWNAINGGLIVKW